VNAASRARGLPYSRFIHGLQAAGVQINRKMLADLAVRDEQAFDRLVELAKAKLA
jgi:large subunit ribosomal protein L20